MSEDYFNRAKVTRDKLNAISPTMCMAKWLQVSLHLPQGRTQSCYHPPTHHVPLSELAVTPRALHNTHEKVRQRKQMIEGKRPAGCNYCWKVEDLDNGEHLSDRHYRSSEWWVEDAWDEVVAGGYDENINPRYVEVNFNQACNFKCAYCSPHLSTAWEDDIKKNGPLELVEGNHNQLSSLKQQGLMPIDGAAKHNPYVQAFWEWWPDLYPELKVFRMTGGEPLMDKNTFKIFKYIKDQTYPNDQLELSVTTNLCPPDPKLFNKFLANVKELESIRKWNDPAVVDPAKSNFWLTAFKNFSLFVSVDSVGEQAEYIRSGLDYALMLSNAQEFLTQTDRTEITFINTFNLLSIPKLKDFLQMILDLRVEFGKQQQGNITINPPDGAGDNWGPAILPPRQRVWFDLPYLEYPNWMSAQLALLDPTVMDHLDECLVMMEENINPDYDSTGEGFKEYEVAKLKRNIAWIKSGNKHINNSSCVQEVTNLYMYFKQIDQRRHTSFTEVFPELQTIWEIGKHNKE